ncbi:hypothetical protein B0E55_06324 [Rhodococcus sp. 66b]|nr:hypothetical protein B0E55_06324 [Rhodococcus sp. 66b]
MHRRHTLPHNDRRQIPRITMPIRHGHHQSSTNLQRPEQLPHRHIERERRLLQHHIRRIQPVLVLHPRQPIHNRRMRNRHALRTSRRPRRENHIRRIPRQQRRDPINIRNRVIRKTRHINNINLDHRHHTGIESNVRGTDHAYRRRRLQHVRIALRRLIRIYRNIPTASLEHAVNRNQQINRPTYRNTHQRLRPHTHRNQVPGKTIHPRIELRI